MTENLSREPAAHGKNYATYKDKSNVTKKSNAKKMQIDEDSPMLAKAPAPVSPSERLLLKKLLHTVKAVRQGDFSARMLIDDDAEGTIVEIGEVLNDIISLNQNMADEFVRVARIVGQEGRMTERVSLGFVKGAWFTSMESFNQLIGDLVQPTNEVARVITSVAKGDLSQKMSLEIDGRQVKGEFLRIGTTVNTMVDQLNSFAAEVTRVAKEVGTEGKLGGQAEVKGVSGIWKDLTDNVNGLANNLTAQVRNIAKVTTAVAKGDLSQKITVDAKGEVYELKNTINVMVDQLQSFAAEVTRVAKEVGTEGRLGGQADVKGVSGTWKDLTDNVNSLANNLTAQVRNIAKVTTAVANGDLTQKITVDARGEILELKQTINVMVGQLQSFAAEVTRVAKEVGTEGKLGGQADVKGVSGTWKDLTDNVNGLANNLTAQVRNIAKVTTAVAKGDLSQKITVDAKGEILELKQTINTMVDQLNSFASEVTRVAKEVGTEGKLGGQADVKGVSGTWKDLTDNVNGLAANLTVQLRDMSKVATAIANGDLGQKITVDVKGEILQIKAVINKMVDQLSSFASEVTRVAKEVGTEGKLGGQADVKGVSGIWKDLTDNVNGLAGNLTAQVRNIAKVTTAVAKGDLSQKITADAKGEILELKQTINTMVDQLNSFAAEVTRVAKEVGTEGKLGGQATVKGVSGTWKDLTDNVNGLAANLTAQVRNIAKVTTAIAKGDLSQKITVDARGEILELKSTINTLVDQLNSFASEVTRVAKEVGTEGKLGGQATVKGVSGTWKDLTDNVNAMASNLTVQLRDVSKVATAIANGDLGQKITVDVKGEILQIKDVINKMVDQLSSFASEVTRVAKEVGTEGRLGGQAEVKSVSGVWKDLTDNVNFMASNLTKQVRGIVKVVTAVANGDLSQKFVIEAKGEVAALKDNINQMIFTLKDTTQKNQEQDWLKTNLAKFTEMMQGQRSLNAVAQLTMSELAPLVNAQHGAFFTLEQDNADHALQMMASYGYTERKNVSNKYKIREGLVGQCAFDKRKIHLTNVPTDYIHVKSGLGEAPPLNIIVLPVMFEGELKGVIELASFHRFTPNYLHFLDQLMDSIGVILNMIQGSVRTEELLQELKKSNAELEAQAKELEEKAKLLELKNHEVELASQSLEEKAEQLSLISKYKSEFLANMSHELRTPLNSLLILSKMLSENKSGNLTPEQIKFSTTVHSAGNDLLALINEILDLAKVEAGKMPIDPGEVKIKDVLDYLELAFRPVAEHKSLEFSMHIDSSIPKTFYTDSNRLNQILKNLLSNAFKFTEKGSVDLRIGFMQPNSFGGFDGQPMLSFSVTDTGIGIPKDKQRLVFEAFQQADGTTSRKYGGTGLGLTISREIARLLGGTIDVTSFPEKGSTFTLVLPLRYIGAEVQSPTSLSIDVVNKTLPLPEDADFTNKKVLVVDDDIRNVYAITSMLEERNMKVLFAENGKLALDILQNTPGIDLVLMDTMMPEMDGLSATREIRKNEKFVTLPIISLTAKAMKGDREKCLEAGASDYITKPVESEALLSMMHMWFTKSMQNDEDAKA